MNKREVRAQVGRASKKSRRKQKEAAARKRVAKDKEIK